MPKFVEPLPLATLLRHFVIGCAIVICTSFGVKVHNTMSHYLRDKVISNVIQVGRVTYLSFLGIDKRLSFEPRNKGFITMGDINDINQTAHFRTKSFQVDAPWYLKPPFSSFLKSLAPNIGVVIELASERDFEKLTIVRDHTELEARYDKVISSKYDHLPLKDIFFMTIGKHNIICNVYMCFSIYL